MSAISSGPEPRFENDSISIGAYKNWGAEATCRQKAVESSKMLRAVQFIVLQLLLVSAVHRAAAEKVMRPKFKDAKLWSDNKHVSHSIAFDPTDPHLNFTVNVLQDVNNVDLHTETRITQKLDPTYFMTFNATINLCRVLSWRNNSPIGNLVHLYLQEYGTMIESCPIKKGEYFMHKFWIPEDTTLAAWPEVDFEMSFSAFSVDASKKRELIINDYVAGEFVVQDVNNVKRGILALLPRVG